MFFIRRSLLAFASCFLFHGLISSTSAADWSSWRGSDGNGATGESTIPDTWDNKSNVRWKVELPGPGNSSPIVYGNRVWVTQFDKESNERQLRCYAADSGQHLWTRGVESDAEEATHPTNPYCAASPVTNGNVVVAFFGAAGLCCYDVDGRELWRQQFGEPQHLFGQGASPFIHGEFVTLNFGPGKEQFWVTLDLKSGKELWRLNIDQVDAPNPFDQPDGPKLPPGTKLRDPFGTWATPILTQTDNRRELILAFPKELRAVEPASGATLWTCQELGNQVLSSPFLVNDSIVVCLGATALAVRTAGTGDVTESHRLWFKEEDRPRIGTGVGMGSLVVANTMQGIVEAIDAETGEQKWQKRLTSAAGGGSWSSLVRSGDRFFATNKDGTIYVFRAEPEFELLSTNKLDEHTNASPALTEDSIYIRTDKHLWCIGS